MKKLYIIGNKKSEFARPSRVSLNSAIKDDEHIYATISSDSISLLTDELDIHFADYKTSPGHYSRSADVLIGFIRVSIWNDLFSDIEFSMEIFDFRGHGYTTSIVRRAMPPRPQS